MIKVGKIVTGIYGLGQEDILYPDSSLMYTGLIINRIRTSGDEYYELYCKDGKFRKFHSREILDPPTVIS